MIDPERYASLGEELETCPACGYRCPGSYHYCPACGAAMVGGGALPADRPVGAASAPRSRALGPAGGFLAGLAAAWVLLQLF
ncbi:MAG: hypothetical protein AAFZ65_08305 [Planctomycetota bacterium]